MRWAGLLPPSTNAAYGGAAVSAWFLGLSALGSLVPGLIHYGLPDGGAGTIAGIDLSTRRETIVAVFAWYGALQIPHGLAQLAVALRYRSLVPLFLLLVILERGLVAVDAWFGRGAGIIIRPSTTLRLPRRPWPWFSCCSPCARERL